MKVALNFDENHSRVKTLIRMTFLIKIVKIVKS